MIFDDILQYLTILNNIWQRKRAHLKLENCQPKNIAKYNYLLSSGKRGSKQNIMN